MPQASAGAGLVSGATIVDDSISDADINSAAAIDASKIAGDVETTGAQNVGGVKTFTDKPIVPADAYGAGWNGNQEAAPKDAVYDKIQSLASGVFKNGQTTRDMTAASGAQTIAHGLGSVPKKIRITAFWTMANYHHTRSEGAYDGTTNSVIYQIWDSNSTLYTANGNATTAINLENGGGGKQVGVITVDSTNITITWTKSSTPTGTAYLLWEAE